MNSMPRQGFVVPTGAPKSRNSPTPSIRDVGSEMAPHVITQSTATSNGATGITTNVSISKTQSSLSPISSAQNWVLFPATDSPNEDPHARHRDSEQSSETSVLPERFRISGSTSLRTLDEDEAPISDFSALLTDEIEGSGTASYLETQLENSDDEADLDMLDSHLADFQTTTSPYHNNTNMLTPHFTSVFPDTVFPTHDGHGSFRVRPSHTTSSFIQERLLSFERDHHRRSTPAHPPVNGIGEFPRSKLGSYSSPNDEKLNKLATGLDSAVDGVSRGNNREPANLALYTKPTEALLAASNQAFENDEVQEEERRQRIEAWRLEHGRVLFEEILRETHREHLNSSTSSTQVDSSLLHDGLTPSLISLTRFHEEDDSMEWHDEDDMSMPKDSSISSNDSGLIQRLARNLIRKLLGIDENLLRILLRETPMVDDNPPPKATPVGVVDDKTNVSDTTESPESSSWKMLVMKRVATELGQLAHQIAPHHPGAFATYSSMKQLPIPYGGLSSIPEVLSSDNLSALAKAAVAKFGNASRMMTGFSGSDEVAEQHGSSSSFYNLENERRGEATHSSPNPADVSPLTSKETSDVHVASPVDTKRTASHFPSDSIASIASGLFSQEEWERDLDVKLVFRYLRSRFTPSTPYNASESISSTSATAHLATSSTQDTAVKAARVRQHHPLLSLAAMRHASRASRPFHHHHTRHHSTSSSSARSFRVTSPSTFVTPALGIRHAASGGASTNVVGGTSSTGEVNSRVGGVAVSSCASQSTRRSALATRRNSSSSSRHYWDLGGSFTGTNSARGAAATITGPMGSWGEV